MSNNYIYGVISFNGEVIGAFTFDRKADKVMYAIDTHEYELSFNGFDTMCDALGYDVKLA